MTFNSTEELIEEFRQGRMVVLVDDEDRENEGDLVMPAELVTAEAINFMSKFGRGLICMPLSRERCEHLGLPQMVADNRESHRTKFTVSIDAARGITSGISAADRARTIRDAVAAEARASDVVQPGHVFPLQCEPGGVLSRAGHTEASCDLARLAGLEPAAVLVEILNEDGSMARRPELERFAAHHGLKIGTIAELITYRMLNEKTVVRVGECALPTRFGAFRLVTYQESVTGAVHLALVRGELDGELPALVRVHVQDSLCDITHSERDDCGWAVGDALARMEQEGAGVVVVLRHEEPAEELIRRVQTYAREDAGEMLPAPEPTEVLRTYGVGAQILIDLGVRRMRVLSSPKRLQALSGFGLEVVGYVS